MAIAWLSRARLALVSRDQKSAKNDGGRSKVGPAAKRSCFTGFTDEEQSPASWKPMSAANLEHVVQILINTPPPQHRKSVTDFALSEWASGVLTPI